MRILSGEAELLHSLHHRHVVPCPGFACVEKWQRVLIVMPALQTTLLERMYQDPPALVHRLPGLPANR